MAPPLLRGLIEIPDQVHAGDFVLNLSKGVGEESTIRDYVVTEQLADCFDQALGLIRSAVEERKSQAAYLDGSFGSGKSHFMAVLHAILSNDPEARGKKKLVEVVAKHDTWMQGRRFLLVPYHMMEATSLASAVLGGYVDHVRRIAPGKPLPAVYRDDELLADARDLRATIGDAAFIGGLPADDEWGEAGWDAARLDTALSAPPGDPLRKQLVGELLGTHFKRYATAVSGQAEAVIDLDSGLAEISRHAKNVLGYDAIVLLLDELVLWLSGYVGDPMRIRTEAQKVSKLVESAEQDRPAPIVSFVPRQRDLRDLVGRDTAGATTASLFDTLKYWDGRFDRIKLEDRNLPVIVEARLLRTNPRNPGAKAELDAAFERTATRKDVWDTLLDAQGGPADRAAFRATYPFSPAFLHAMVDISGALQRQRTALKLMQQLLVDYRDLLPVGQLMPLGAIYDVLARGQDRPFSDKLRDEFEQAKRFYTGRLLPYLLAKHRLTEDQLRSLPARHAFRADDLVIKTLLLAALVPNVPALRHLTASRLAALNHGSIATMIPGQDRQVVARTLRELAGEFGEIRVSGSDDPTVEIALIGVDTHAILQQVLHVDDDAAKRRLLKSLLWEEFGVAETNQFVTSRSVIWKGTERTVELIFANVRDPEVAEATFVPDLPGALRVVVDYPFDEGTHTPAEDRHRVWELQKRLGQPPALVWLPSFLSRERLEDLGDLVRISYVLERRDRLDELTPALTDDDRHHARTQLESRKAALTQRITDAMRRAYGIASADDADLGARAEDHIMALDSRLEIRPPAGLAFGDALQRICTQLLDHTYPKHPDFDPQGRKKVFTRSELSTVLGAVERAAQDRVGRLEVPKGDLPVLRRIANPLEIATVGEVFVLRDEWKRLIDTRAAHAGSATDLKIGEIRGWITEEQPGLPDLIVDLLIACYAVQSDRAWMRAGGPIAPQEIGRMTADTVLRRQELPTEDEFRLAGDRAEGLFRLGRQPVRTARAVQKMAEGVRRRAGELLTTAEALVRGLEAHAATLGLDDDAPRLATARTVAGLLDRIAGAPNDPTEVLGRLSEAALDREPEIYRASLEGARDLTATLGGLKWPILDQLPAIAGGADSKAEPARAILDQLRDATRRDEHQVPLGTALDDAEEAAIALIIGLGPGPTPPPPPPPPTPGIVRKKVVGAKVDAALEELLDLADEQPDSVFEITWRIVP